MAVQHSVQPDATLFTLGYHDAYVVVLNGVFFGFSENEFRRLRLASHIEWDSGEEFDDGSYLLQFDVGHQVRLIAYKSWDQNYHHDPDTLRDVWIDADEFYGILQQWHDAFLSEWRIARPRGCYELF